MGLLDSIIRRATNRVVDAAADRVVDQVVDSIRGNGSKNTTNYNTGAQTNNAGQNYNQPVQQTAAVQDNFCDEAECRRRILECLSQKFSSYTVQENVSSTIFGERGGLPYSIMVSQGGAPKLAIMIVGSSTCSHRNYRFSKEAAQNKGVTMINFVGHYPNRPEYIQERLKRFL